MSVCHSNKTYARHAFDNKNNYICFCGYAVNMYALFLFVVIFIKLIQKVKRGVATVAATVNQIELHRHASHPAAVYVFNEQSNDLSHSLDLTLSLTVNFTLAFVLYLALC